VSPTWWWGVHGLTASDRTGAERRSREQRHCRPVTRAETDTIQSHLFVHRPSRRISFNSLNANSCARKESPPVPVLSSIAIASASMQIRHHRRHVGEIERQRNGVAVTYRYANSAITPHEPPIGQRPKAWCASQGHHPGRRASDELTRAACQAGSCVSTPSPKSLLADSHPSPMVNRVVRSSRFRSNQVPRKSANPVDIGWSDVRPGSGLSENRDVVEDETPHHDQIDPSPPSENARNLKSSLLLIARNYCRVEAFVEIDARNERHRDMSRVRRRDCHTDPPNSVQRRSANVHRTCHRHGRPR